MKSLLTTNTRTADVFSQMDRLFNSFFNEADLDLAPRPHKVPLVDIKENGDSYVLEAELPGLTEKDVEVKIDENLLVIKTNKAEEKQEKAANYIMKERSNLEFNRSFVLPKDADKEKIDASFKNGLLELTIHKLPQAKPRLIEVKRG